MFSSRTVCVHQPLISLFEEDLSMKKEHIVSKVCNLTNCKKNSRINDDVKYCIMLTSGKTHLNICVVQMVLRYSHVGGVYYWYVKFVRRLINTALLYTSFRLFSLNCQLEMACQFKMA